MSDYVREYYSHVDQGDISDTPLHLRRHRRAQHCFIHTKGNPKGKVHLLETVHDTLLEPAIDGNSLAIQPMTLHVQLEYPVLF